MTLVLLAVVGVLTLVVMAVAEWRYRQELAATEREEWGAGCGGRKIPH